VKFIIHTQYYRPEIGAPPARLSELAERLVQYGHEVFVITAMANYPLGYFYPGYGGMIKREVINGVSILRTWIYPSKSLRFLPRLTNYFSFVFSSLLIGIALLPKADYLLTESPPLFLGISGYFLSRLKRARWIFNVSDLWLDSAVHYGMIGDGIILRICKYLEAFCYRKAWLVTGQSREILDAVKQMIPDTYTYHLTNGVDASRYTTELRSNSLHKELGEGAECVAIYAGLHGIAQGLDQIIEAARGLEDLNGKLMIVLIGDGPEKEKLMRNAIGLKNIKFLDPKPNEFIPELLASSDIAIVPLKMHIPGSVPSKIYEAMACGLPVVLVAEGEAVNIVCKSGAGIIVAPGDIENIAQALRKLTLDADLRRKLGEQGQQAAIKNYDRNLIVSNFNKFIQGATK
jgi:colanic acid biosynthesis glycosyl transferase WcaI